jgi:uncharacterized membrane protein
MDKFVVVVFPDERRAYEGVSQLRQLHEEGSVSLWATSVVRREADGTLTIVQEGDPGPLGVGVGALTGGLIGLFGGPVGAAVGLAGGGVVGDALHAGVSRDFLEELRGELAPGKYAVVAEVSEDWLAPLDTRMDALGGNVIREAQTTFVDDMIETRANAVRDELSQRRTEHAGAKAERMESKLNDRIEKTQEKLQKAAEKARARLDDTKEELNAKIHALEEQSEQAPPEVKQRVQQRIAEIRKDFEQREQKLTRAYELTQEALH